MIVRYVAAQARRSQTVDQVPVNAIRVILVNCIYRIHLDSTVNEH
jgi:hypothetical protein